jgi:hypothetical protein
MPGGHLAQKTLITDPVMTFMGPNGTRLFTEMAPDDPKYVLPSFRRYWFPFLIKSSTTIYDFGAVISVFLGLSNEFAFFIISR